MSDADNPKFDIESEAELEALRKRMKDPFFLPSHEDIRKVFPTREEWDKYKNDSGVKFHELLNKEFLEALANYIIERANVYQGLEGQPLIILEIGAGDGRLAHFLQEELNKRAKGKFVVVATDSGAWKTEHPFPVEIFSYKDALENYHPKIVVCSWMNPGEDWTAGIRSTRSVEEYILIGGISTCGDSWNTWGIPPMDADPQFYQQSSVPYVKDGFEIAHMDGISCYQIARTDHLAVADTYHSSTNSFRRKK